MPDLGIAGVGQAVPIGEGGFATVYRAQQTTLHRTVAVKVINDRSLDDVARRRFERECEALGKLSGHPGIVTVYDGGFTDDGFPYLVMEHMAGGSYKDRLAADGPLGWEASASTGVSLARSLQAAHDAGIIHRDIKPANILIDRFGSARLADFGIARVVGREETRSGVVTTSVAHAPPEVLDRKRPTTRSDIYALASTLFELATGQAPFERPDDDSLASTMARILFEPAPDPRTFGAPEAIASVIERAMAKDPDVRFDSADAFGAALQEALDHPGMPEGTLPVGFLPPVPVLHVELPDEPATQPEPAPAPPPVVAFRPTPPPTTPPPGAPVRGTNGPTGPTAPVPPPPPPRRSGSNAGWWAAVAVVVLLVGVIGAYLLTNTPDDDPASAATTATSAATTTTTPVVAVPDVRGLAGPAAEAQLRNADFDVEIVESASAEIPEGDVIAQRPAAGEQAPADSVVRIRVSTGPGIVDVPDVTGLTADDALAQLTEAQLEVTRTEDTSDEVATGSVISQDPVAGAEVEAGSTVRVVISSGPASVVVPSVIGFDAERAEAGLLFRGLPSTTVPDFSGAGDVGTVVRMDPPAGTRVPPGTEVVLFVATAEGE